MNKKFIAILILAEIFFAVPSVYADSFKSILIPTSDSFVDEDAPNKNYGNIDLLATGSSCDPNLPECKGGKEVRSYLKFDITNIPQSNLASKTEIDSVQLQLLTSQIWGGVQNYSFLVTVSYCDDSSWDEKNITWNNKVCKEEKSLEGVDSNIVRYADLPKVLIWDVTGPVTKSREAGKSDVTFVLKAYELRGAEPRDYKDFIFWFFSKEGGKKYGSLGEPNLSIAYTTTHPISDNLSFFVAVVLPVLAGVYSITRWMYRKEKDKNYSHVP